MSDRSYYQHHHQRSAARAMPMLMPVQMPARAKSVTDPLDDRVKARLIRPDSGVGEGYASSSGSEHEGLSGVLRIDGFFFDDSDDEGDRGGRRADDADDGWSDDDNQEDGDDNDGNEGEKKRRAGSRRPGGKSSSASSSSSPFSSLSKHTAAVIRDMMRVPATSALKDAFRRDLHAAITAAVELHGHLINSSCSSSSSFGAVDGGKSAFRRSVMCTLRNAGYNAGVCKSRWGGTSGITAGSYEYIDVVRPGSSPVAQGERYIVDVGFGAEFEIARPTEEYTRVAAELPAVYVGRPDELRPALRVLADASKRSMRESGIHVPPWRKLRYVLAKWLGPYKRTTNAEPAAPGCSSTSKAAAGTFPMPQSSFGPATFQKLPATAVVQCRAVGFQQPATFAVGTPLTRTR